MISLPINASLHHHDMISLSIGASLHHHDIIYLSINTSLHHHDIICINDASLHHHDGETDNLAVDWRPKVLTVANQKARSN